jgi:HK97 family phage prohead protease
MALDVRDRASVAHSVRSFDFTECEFRDDGPNGFVTFEGIASVVDTPYQVRDQWGTFTETIRAGSFNKTLKDGKADVALFVNHDTRALPLATRLDGSLVLGANPHLTVRATLNPARPSVQEVRHAVTDGQARQMSIGFSVPKARDQWNDTMTERTISEVALGETSIVWRGASPTTTGAIRSFDEFMSSLTDVDMSEVEARRAIKSLQHRFADVWSSDLEEMLCDAVCALLGCGSAECEIEDYTDSAVVYCTAGICYQLAYSLDAQGLPVLAATDPTPVVEVTMYKPITRTAPSPVLADHQSMLLRMWEAKRQPLALV